METTALDNKYYTDAIDKIQNQLKDLTFKFNLLSISRLIVLISAIACIIQAIRLSANIYFLIGLLLFILFFILVSIHLKISSQKKYKEDLLKINVEELEYLQDGLLPFDKGNAYIDTKHAYTYDLDIFGTKSLYHHLVRAYTYMGRHSFASMLMSTFANYDIIANQAAVKELGSNIQWRQHFSAIARGNEDTKQAYDKVVAWSTIAPKEVSIFYRILTYLFPCLFCLALGHTIYSKSLDNFHYVSSLFIVNLLLAGTFFKQIKNEIQYSTDIADTIKKNGLLIEAIVKENFESSKLCMLKNEIKKGHDAANALKKLSSLFSSLDSALNPMGMILSNGSILLHVHVYIAMQQWKKEHSKYLPLWLDAIGQMEALICLGNFHYNNPAFSFPTINKDNYISFSEMGHPLIHPDKRVGNDVTFTPQHFIVLTGSNMSGKSTFLRSLGVNMILTNIGAPVCADKASIHPLPVFVAMRQTDSLSDGESYFFAEVKRLHDIMKALVIKPHFVLLDEILRGTNSDDKRSGTIGVIEKILHFNAIGAIATHDIEVCRITDDHPSQLTNQCFEVQIINDELVFDYKLRAGICRNKSATFLMRKMGVIRQ